ncbi:conserved hypothetical protein [Aspergillus terreus NIH2624]|uniref:FAD-dependent monooxygenase ATEG_03635 n=1 Tax=Aspergillus terreus (strain NIH 2624 / FGSC A1156) TaxID=341663 RepID=AZPA4_ASPTN|nr:uncharacterized protein ATEG_03635 [Aspergillus terreus NIH2624]Q0CRP9.1 RecName: Full=FAD-dependent monooxygenase ATEG_03635; AltName: Full=Azasperpyranone A biosynthesis cluster A protein ATEG_03635 [Aspergillus terreus NIH2624]EAU35437.1 conserved hypothetical protein [Aspergillus terreus NIH2624]
MASTLPPQTWEAGYARPADQASWEAETNYVAESGERAHWMLPVHTEPPTSTIGNGLGLTHLRTWPSIYDGTATGKPEWFKPSKEVDVLICGAGPFGLELGLILARQGISFRIVDKANAPCLSGRADGVHPRALEQLHAWGLAHEVSEEGPILNSTVLFRNGVKLFHGFSSTCDSRYKGIHIITQGQMERIYIRDLLRHQIVVERGTTVQHFNVQSTSQDHPVRATLKNVATGEEEVVRARYLIGADGAASSIREQLGVEFDGITTDIYWAIMDCRFKTDYPHILGFNIIISAEHGGSIVIPREDGYTRFYTQINGEKARKLQANRQARRNASTVGETRIDDHGITPDEVLEQLNKIIAPHKVEFASPMSWFSVWRVSERVARHFSSPDLRVHLGGDAAVLGAFGLNSSIYDAANLGWKLGLVLRKHAEPSILTTYDKERRLFANRVIRCSGAYLRFICNSSLPLAALRDLGEHLESHDENLPLLDGSTEADREFLYTFFKRHAMFLLGVEWPIVNSAICPADTKVRASSLRNGVRAPNPRVCLATDYTAYLYDKMMGVGRFHLLLFGSDLQGPVRQRLAVLAGELRKREGFYERFGGREMFNLILVVKTLSHQTAELLEGDLAPLKDHATTVYDDRAPDDDAHYWYGVNHARGALVVVRPDLAVGVSVWPEEIGKLNKYFASFLLECEETLPTKKSLLARLWDAL